MPRYKLTIEYDGTPYCGWQQQAELRSVQQAIEEAVEKFSGERRRLATAGRTDAGVHALAQVAHVDLERDWPTDKVRDALNAHLTAAGDLVFILAAEKVADTFSARLSAQRRRYLYRIVNRRPPPALDRLRAWHVIRPLDIAAMREGARHLVGHHDFSTFRATDCQAKSPMKTLERVDVRREGEFVLVETAARSFLHHQVRFMVGSLVQVGLGRWQPDDVLHALEARNLQRSGPMAPAHGLYFVGVDY
jgi:tRNA pseudouridine38-40 synthase